MHGPGYRTPRTLSWHLHSIPPSYLPGWTTPKIQLSRCPRRINVRRSLFLFPGARKAQSPGSIDSGRCEVLARRGYPLPVSLPRSLLCYAIQLSESLSRWEFFTTLDYEWRVIRRRLPYRWTILVRNDRCSTLFLSSAMLRPWVDLLIR
jgi:hypothetical protein